MNTAIDTTLSTPGQDTDSDQRYDNQPPSFTGAQSLKASFNLGYDGIADSAIRMLTMNQTEGFAKENPMPPTSVEELNKQYPNLAQPFTEATDPFVAGEIARRQTEKADLQAAVQYGPQTGAYAVGRFGAGLLAGASDPFFAAAAVATGGLAEAALGGTAVGDALGYGVEKSLVWDSARAGIKAGSKTFLQNAATGAIEGASAQAVAEPFKALADHEDHTPYSLTGAFGRIESGALSFAILKSGGAELARLLNPAQLRQLELVANSRLANDKIPDVEPLVHAFAMEQSGHINPDSGIQDKYKFNKIDDPNGQKWFVPKDSIQPNVQSGKMLPVGDQMGTGVHMTDNPAVANGIAAPKINDVPGSVHTVSFDGKKLEDLEKFSTPEFTAAAQEALNSQGLKFDPTTRTGRQIMKGAFDEINGAGNRPYGQVQEEYQAFVQKLQFESKIRGIDGYQYTIDHTGPVEHQPYNAAMLFDPKDLTEHESAQASPEAVYQPDPTQARDILNNTLAPFDSTIFHNTPHQEDFDSKIGTETVAPMERADIEAQVEQNVNSVKQQLQQFPDLPGAQALLDDFKDIDKDAKDSSDVLENAFDCFKAAGGE